MDLLDIEASLDAGHIDPHCGGGISGDIINAISGIFKDKIKDKVDSQGASAVKSLIEAEAQKLLKEITWTYTLEKDVAVIDFSPQTISSSGQYLSVGVLAETYNPSTHQPPPFPNPVKLPSWDTSAPDAYAQIFLSPWALESIAFTYFAADHLQRFIDHTIIDHLHTGVTLNTTDVGLFAPGLPKAYPQKWMWLVGRVTGAPRVRIGAKNGVRAVAPVEVEFYVQTGDKPNHQSDPKAFSIGCNLTVGVDFHMQGGSAGGQLLVGNITTASFPFELIHTEVGAVNVAGMLSLLDAVENNLLLPLVDAFLQKGIPLPSSQHFELEDTVLTPRDGYILVSSKFNVKP